VSQNPDLVELYNQPDPDDAFHSFFREQAHKIVKKDNAELNFSDLQGHENRLVESVMRDFQRNGPKSHYFKTILNEY
jgi:hypothetical protein